MTERVLTGVRREGWGLARASAGLVLLLACTAESSTRPEPPDDPPPSGSANASITLSADTVTLGESVVISVAPRDSSGAKRGPGQAVTISASGGAGAGELGPTAYFAWDSTYRAIFTGTTVGAGVRVSASVAGAPVATTLTLAVRPAAAPALQMCSPVGAVCDFLGLRNVTLAASNGATYTQEFFGGVPCAGSGYDRGFTGAPSEPWTHCLISEPLTSNLVNTQGGMAGLDAPILRVPRGGAGIPRQLVRGSSYMPAPIGEGSFRMTCTLAKMDFFDPIVSPGQANSAHLHMFFGNAGIVPSSTAGSLASSGSGTCSGGTVNRTGYWVPAMFDVRTSEIIMPDYATIYYKTGYNVDPATVREIPAGLVMIAGNSRNVSGAQFNKLLPVTQWSCETQAASETGAIADCPVGDVAILVVNFPQCWDGVRLDSPDHQSHMAYPDYRNPPARSTCPASHPVMLPIITEIFRWPVRAGMSTAFWRLASDMYPLTTRGGFSAHADWMNGWDQSIFRTIVTECLNAGKDCGVGLLGDGRELY
jgi:hypothetical protein